MESDSLDAINFIKHGCPALHSCASLVKEIRTLSSRIQQVHWNYIPREVNSHSPRSKFSGGHSSKEGTINAARSPHH
ncbi:hypothetical protein AHAS_Ahas08G0137700 [Arachis hypogaea]